MALDYGEVRIGIAFSDELQTIAFPYETYKRKGTELDLKYFADLVKKEKVVKIILGYPINMNGSVGERALKTKEFGEELYKVAGIDIEYIDERLTSVEAEEILINSNVKRAKRKELLDKIAAALILENYLNRKTVLNINNWKGEIKWQKKKKSL